MRIRIVAISAMAVVALGMGAVAQQKAAPKSTATAITVYKTPT